MSNEAYFCLLCLGVPLLFLLLREGYVSLSQQGRGQLRDRAQADYESARGTAHKRMLESSHAILQKQIEEADARLSQYQRSVSEIQNARRTELRQAVVRQLVQTELSAIPGLGSRLASTILDEVFRGELDDLGFAFRIDGVGPQKQAAINTWVHAQKVRLPDLIAGDFPGKSAILDQYEGIITSRLNIISKEKGELVALRELLQLVTQELKWLYAVQSKDFEQALLNSETVQAEVLNRYQIGVFAPWEYMPDWFREAVQLTSSPSTAYTTETEQS